jgi:hypothetical protein
MRTRFTLLGITLLAMAVVQPLGAADSKTASLTVSATVSATAVLAIGSATVIFPDRNPDDFPSIAASPDALTITAKGKTSASSSVTLTIQASGDLTSGGDTIPISRVTWTATGDGFSAGTMAQTAVTVGSWTSSGNRSGSLAFALANSWNYPTGSYSTLATFTLTAP